MNRKEILKDVLNGRSAHIIRDTRGKIIVSSVVEAFDSPLRTDDAKSKGH